MKKRGIVLYLKSEESVLYENTVQLKMCLDDIAYSIIKDIEKLKKNQF